MLRPYGKPGPGTVINYAGLVADHKDSMHVVRHNDECIQTNP